MKQLLPSYSAHHHDIVHALPAAMHANVAKTITASSTVSGTAPLHPPIAPLCASAGNVVAKAFVGFGVPLTVTVGAALFGDRPLFVGLLPAARTVNLGEVACMTPCVEFKKIRK